MNIKEIQELLKIDFKVSKELYTWSTWILPDGSFIHTDTYEGDEDYDDVFGEHEHVLQYLEDNEVINKVSAETIIEASCIKINYSDPYIALPVKDNPTYNQYRSLQKVLEYMYEDNIYMDKDTADVLYYNKNNPEFSIPIITSKLHANILFDILVYEPKDIIKELQQLLR